MHCNFFLYVYGDSLCLKGFLAHKHTPRVGTACLIGKNYKPEICFLLFSFCLFVLISIPGLPITCEMKSRLLDVAHRLFLLAFTFLSALIICLTPQVYPVLHPPSSLRGHTPPPVCLCSGCTPWSSPASSSHWEKSSLSIPHLPLISLKVSQTQPPPEPCALFGWDSHFLFCSPIVPILALIAL